MRRSRKTKTILRRFRYRECDAFAAFLHEQSMKGWHFKEWKFGLVFERGNAQDVAYDVQVFPKGKERDTKPESDALDYAVYCEAAGWELVDGKNCFCIFRKCDESAAPIVTEEEKFQNVCRAEWRKWLGALLGYGAVLTIFLYIYVLSPNMAWYLYNNVMVFAVCVAAIRFMWRAADGIWLLCWTFRQKRRLTTGKKLVYDKAGLEKDGLVYLRETLLFVILLLTVYQAGYGMAVLPVILFLFTVYSVKIVFSYMRPDRADAWTEPAAILGITFTALILFVGTLFAGGWSDVSAALRLDRLPLVQADYKDTEGSYKVIDSFRQTGVFGEMAVCAVQYESPDDIPLEYEVYESEIPWVVMRTWKCKISRLQKSRSQDTEVKECAGQWGALEAVLVNDMYYLVRYEDRVWMVNAGETLDKEQIQIIKEKLSAM